MGLDFSERHDRIWCLFHGQLFIRVNLSVYPHTIRMGALGRRPSWEVYPPRCYTLGQLGAQYPVRLNSHHFAAPSSLESEDEQREEVPGDVDVCRRLPVSHTSSLISWCADNVAVLPSPAASACRQ